MQISFRTPDGYGSGRGRRWRTPTTATATVGNTAAVAAARVVDAFEAARLPATGRVDRTEASGCADLKCSQMIAVDSVSVYQFVDEAAAEKYASALSASSLIYRNGSIVLRFKRDGPSPIDRVLIPRYQAVLDDLLP